MAIRLLQPHTLFSSSASSSWFPRTLCFFSSSSSSFDDCPPGRENNVTIDTNDDSDGKLPKMEPSNDADLLSQVLIHHHNPFHATESSLQLHGISLTPSLLHQTLLRLHHNSKIAFSLFQYSLSLPPSTIVTSTAYNLIIDILSKVRQFDVVWQLIIHMDQRNVQPTFLTFSILIRRLIAAGLTRQAVRAFDDMGSFIPEALDETHFCFLLDTLCKYGCVKVAVEIFNQRKCGFRPNVRMYTILIYGWCKVGRIDMAERFLREMGERGIEPNIVTYNVLLNGICRRAKLQPEGRLERVITLAENVFDEMRCRGIEPDVTSFSIVLHVYSRAHMPQLTLDKLNLMKERGICPTVATYTSVIKCLCSCGRIGDAEELLGEMVRNGVSPSAATYNCFFKEYKGRKNADSALKLYRKMREGDLCPPSVHTYNILLGMFMKLNRMEIVEEIWDDLKASSLGPYLDSYTTLIHGLCEKQKWKEACQLFVEMIERGLLPRKVTFETLYRGLIQSDMLRTWRRLKKKLDEESITFGSEFQNYHLKPYRR
uniref:Pentatricopeptide repeat-containing protein n=1 Tax=Rhizophora mucronata TaxID=61149 RepID=A0A2P2MGW8_RHIMU